MTRQVKNAIGAYVQSDGVNLPPDWEDHIIGGDMYDSCVFCKKTLNESRYIVPTLESTDFTAPLPLKICYECHDDITANASPEWFASQDYLSTGGTSIWAATIEDVFLPFIESGIYPDKMELDNFEACDFCCSECTHIYDHFSSFKNIKEGRNFKHILPVKKNVNLIEAPIISCIRCESAIEVLSQKISSTKSYQEIVMANCYNCNCSYPLKVEEYEARQEIAMKVPLNEYVCPLCAGELWEDQSRWVTTECIQCKRQSLFDRMHKDFFRGNYKCSCKSKKKDVGLNTLTFIYDIKGEKRHIAINRMEVVCGGVKKYIFTVVDNDAGNDKDNVLYVGTEYNKCTHSREGNCGCTAADPKVLNGHIAELHIQIINHLKNDSS